MATIEQKKLFVSKIKDRVANGKGGVRVKKKKNVIATNNGADSEDYSDIEYEDERDYRPGGYHPVRIGEIFHNNRYHVVQKLGWGYFSTVWLCWDSDLERFVAIKVQKSAKDYQEAALDEIELLSQLYARFKEDNDTLLLDNFHIVALLDHFYVRGPNGKHICMVFELMGNNLLSLIREYDYRGIPLEYVRVILKDVLMGLDMMHSKCKIIHTDLKPENILRKYIPEKFRKTMKTYQKPPKCGVPLTQRTDIENLSKKQLKKLKRKLKKDSDQKMNENNTSTEVALDQMGLTDQQITETISKPKERVNQDGTNLDNANGSLYPEISDSDDHHVKIADFGNSCWVDKQFTDEVQTRQYRSPEVILGMKYSTPIDIWSAACVAFELATGDFLFNPRESSGVSRDEDHLALIAELLGEFPQRMKSSGKRWHHFFDRQGKFRHVRSLKFWPVEDVLREKYHIHPADAKCFANLLEMMLAIDPQRRATAGQCLQHAFFTRHVLQSEISFVERIMRDKKYSDVSIICHQ
jgi:serine/threonine-protein kinase SRPK3